MLGTSAIGPAPDRQWIIVRPSKSSSSALIVAALAARMSGFAPLTSRLMSRYCLWRVVKTTASRSSVGSRRSLAVRPGISAETPNRMFTSTLALWIWGGEGCDHEFDADEAPRRSRRLPRSRWLTFATQCDDMPISANYDERVAGRTERRGGSPKLDHLTRQNTLGREIDRGRLQRPAVGRDKHAIHPGCESLILRTKDREIRRGPQGNVLVGCVNGIRHVVLLGGRPLTWRRGGGGETRPQPARPRDLIGYVRASIRTRGAQREADPTTDSASLRMPATCRASTSAAWPHKFDAEAKVASRLAARAAWARPISAPAASRKTGYPGKW